MDERPLVFAVVVGLLVVLAQNGVVDSVWKSANTFLVQNYLVGWFVVPLLVAGLFLWRRSIIPVNAVSSPDKGFKNAMLEKNDEFLARWFAKIKQFYRDHPRLPYFLWDASKPNALAVRTFEAKSKRVADELGLPYSLCVAYFSQHAPTPAGNRVGFIGSPLALINKLGASNFSHALTQSVGYSAEYKNLEQLRQVALESGDQGLIELYGQALAQNAPRSNNPLQPNPQGAK